MDQKTIELLAAIFFILIGVVGGGFVIKEIQIPSVPPWARIVSGFLGLIFLCIYFVDDHKIAGLKGKEIIVDDRKIEDLKGKRIIYSYEDSNISPHGFKLINVSAKCIHNPPQINDSIEVGFTLQNINKKSMRVLETFIVGRDPDGNNRDFGYSHENKIIQPNEIIKTEGNIIVDAPGVWKFGPSYELDKDIYPGEWQRFAVRVAP